jgi:hypothetical protein
MIEQVKCIMFKIASFVVGWNNLLGRHRNVAIVTMFYVTMPFTFVGFYLQSILIVTVLATSASQQDNGQ